MGSTAERDDPKLWDEVKQSVTARSKGGAAGEWSARKAQLAVAEYKRRGGGYVGDRKADNSLHQWTGEEWGTASGKPSGETHERYLPERARAALRDDDYARTTAKKRDDTRKGRQRSPQPDDVARKTKPYRDAGSGDTRTKADLYADAKRRDIRGRSRMSKAELAAALND